MALLSGRDEKEHFDEAECALWQLDPAWAKAAHFWRTGIRFGHGRSLRLTGLYSIHGALELHERRFQKGDTLTLLHAINFCAQENLPLPTWLAQAFAEVFGRYLSVAGPHSLDEVFSSGDGPKKTAKKAAQAKQDWDLGLQLLAAAWGCAQADEDLNSLDSVVVAVLAQGQWGVKKTKARALILAVDKAHSEFLAAYRGTHQEKGLSQYLARRRKR